MVAGCLSFGINGHWAVAVTLAMTKLLNPSNTQGKAGAGEEQRFIIYHSCFPNERQRVLQGTPDGQKFAPSQK